MKPKSLHQDIIIAALFILYILSTIFWYDLSFYEVAVFVIVMIVLFAIAIYKLFMWLIEQWSK